MREVQSDIIVSVARELEAPQHTRGGVNLNSSVGKHKQCQQTMCRSGQRTAAAVKIIVVVPTAAGTAVGTAVLQQRVQQ